MPVFLRVRLLLRGLVCVCCTYICACFSGPRVH